MLVFGGKLMSKGLAWTKLTFRCGSHPSFAKLPVRWKSNASSKAIRSGDVMKTLQERGFISQTTGWENIEQLVRMPITVYAGIDPTADSVHVGNLVVLMALFHFYRHGHKPIYVVGGATGMIGDPSGRCSEREPLTAESLRRNVAGIQSTLKRLFTHAFDNHMETPDFLVCNNHDWFQQHNIVSFLAQYGRYFRMSTMLSKESVQSRLNSEEGMSFVEFTYQIFQAFDFYHLFRSHQCQLQVGGSDQWGNIVAGLELIKKCCGDDSNVHGITIPLLTTSSGVKFGKSMGNAIWLDPDKTSPFQLYQFFVRTEDADVERFLLLFTFLSVPEIEDICKQHEKEPHLRCGQKMLASQVVRMIHGSEALLKAELTTKALFECGEEEAKVAIQEMSAVEILDVFSNVPTVKLQPDDRSCLSVVDLILKAGFSESKRKALKLIQGGGVYINYRRVNPSNSLLEDFVVVHNSISILRRGKKDYAVIHWTNQDVE